MGLFDKFKKKSPEELQALEDNKKLLEEFNMTKALGVKKYLVAQQFIYDQDKRLFCVVNGPAEEFKEKEPWIISYDQVEAVWLEVDEW
ncbi:MAG: hypothetical protein Q4C49_11130 [Bacillota bacterium]|nr:hypothetical protein [Bacillota bacterium]